MNKQRKRKLSWILFFLGIMGLVTALITYALRQNINLFFTPSDMAAGKIHLKQKVRLGGMVEKGSILRNAKDMSVQFKVTDFKHSVTVVYQGILPDLFREGQGIVALGKPINASHFKAEEVLAKHDANYMPPEVKNALGEKGQANLSKMADKEGH